jgi:Flp pilus assembly protein CpaB
MKQRTLLIVAGVLGVAAVGLLQVESWRTQGGTVYVFRATRNVTPPATLSGAYEPVGIPRNSYDAMASTVPTRDLERWVSATPLVRPVRAGDTITFDVLQKAADSGPQIQPGMRAVGIEVGEAQAVGFLIRPGDLVDVLGTVPEAQATITRHLLQAKRVLATDQQYRLEDSAFLQNRSYNTITLEVTPAEAEAIEAFRTQVRDGFALSLRPKGDVEVIRSPSWADADAVRVPARGAGRRRSRRSGGSDRQHHRAHWPRAGQRDRAAQPLRIAPARLAHPPGRRAPSAFGRVEPDDRQRARDQADG